MSLGGDALKGAGSGAAAGAAFGPWGAAIGGAIGAIGSVANGLIGKKGAKESRKWEEQQAQIQRDWNEQMMDKQNQFTVDMWNRTNEYNTPEQQVQRMKDAGLNPLYYGLDGSSSNGIESAQALGYQRPEGVESPTTAGLNAALQTAQTAANVRLTNAQATKTEIENRTLPEQIRASIDKVYADTDSVSTNTLYQQILIDNGYPENLAEKLLSEIGVTNATITKVQAETDLANAQTALAVWQKEAGEKKLQEEINLLCSQTRANNASAALDTSKKLIEEFRYSYMKQYNTDVPSGALVSLISWLTGAVDEEFRNDGNGDNPSTLQKLIDPRYGPFGWAIKKLYNRAKESKLGHSGKDSYGYQEYRDYYDD